MADYIYLMESRLTPNQQRGVTLVQDTARAHGMNVYLAGGAIRDIISGSMIRDLDFAVQGSALKLQKDLEKAGAVIQGSDAELQSMYVRLPGGARASVIAARSESYDRPGRPPRIEFSTINEDLRRRDFTVNAMALSLNPGSRGLLLDPYNGVADIESKILRILHNYAFLEEPSRLIRASRFAARFHWTLEERTQARYDAARENEYIKHVSDRRLGHEIEQIAHEDDPLYIMKVLEKEGWLKVLHPHWNVARVDTAGLGALIKTRQQMMDLGLNPDAAPAVMHFITRKMAGPDVAQLQKMIPRKGFVGDWRNLEAEARELSKKLSGKEAATPSQTWKLLSDSLADTVLYLESTGKQKAVTQKIRNYLGKWRQMKSRLPLPEMAELRITTDLPEYPKLAEEIFLMLLDGKLSTQAEVIKFLTPYSPPEPPPPPPARRGRARKAETKPADTRPPATSPPLGEGVPASSATPVIKGKRGRKPKLQATLEQIVPAEPPVQQPVVDLGGVPKKPPATVGITAKPGKPAGKGKVKKIAPGKPANKKAGMPAKPAKSSKPAKPAAKAKSGSSAKKAPAKKASAKKAAGKKPAATKAGKKKGRR